MIALWVGLSWAPFAIVVALLVGRMIRHRDQQVPCHDARTGSPDVTKREDDDMSTTTEAGTVTLPATAVRSLRRHLADEAELLARIDAGVAERLNVTELLDDVTSVRLRIAAVLGMYLTPDQPV